MFRKYRYYVYINPFTISYKPNKCACYYREIKTKICD